MCRTVVELCVIICVAVYFFEISLQFFFVHFVSHICIKRDLYAVYTEIYTFIIVFVLAKVAFNTLNGFRVVSHAKAAEQLHTKWAKLWFFWTLMISFLWALALQSYDNTFMKWIIFLYKKNWFSQINCEYGSTELK